MPAPQPDLLEDFLVLDRRRLSGHPPLDLVELTRWEELRDQLERATGAIRPLGVERREGLRVPTRLQVRVSWEDACELVRACDLSEGGVFLQTSHPNAPGTEVELELRDARGRPLSLEGTVAWSRRESDGFLAPGMGVRFRNLDDWDTVLLAELVESALRVLGRRDSRAEDGPAPEGSV